MVAEHRAEDVTSKSPERLSVTPLTGSGKDSLLESDTLLPDNL